MSNGLATCHRPQVGDVLLQVNGKPITTQAAALHLLGEAPAGVVELKIERPQDRGAYVIRYYDSKNAATRVEKGVIRLDKETVRAPSLYDYYYHHYYYC